MVIMEKQGEEVKIDFVHLVVHTHLSFLKATCKIEDLINKAKEYGMSALAKTELGNLCGAPSFVKECKEAGIKPILGTTFNTKIGEIFHPITIIATNHAGYKNLVRLNTLAWQIRFGKEHGPSIQINDIISSDGLIAIIGVEQSGLGFESLVTMLAGKIQPTLAATWYNQQDNDNLAILRVVADKLHLPVVATNNVRYVNQSDHDAYKIALKIGHYDYLLQDPEYYFKSPAEMAQLPFDEEWYRNTIRIADSVQDYQIINKEFIVPTFKDQNGEWGIEESFGKLQIETWNGLAAKGLIDKPEYIKRLEYELDVIKRKKFASYFLIIAEIVDYIKSRGWLSPFGRGSSCGSMICYCLDIIAIDPIKWSIPFERFINEGRIDLPDIDTDITQEGRGDVLKHIAEVHGHDRVAQIATFQTMGLKASIDNVGRALDVAFVQNRELRNKIPEEVEEIDDLSDDVKKELNTVKGWADNAKSLSGITKNFGVHAAGIAIANNPIGDLVPLLPEIDGVQGVQYDMKDLEILGLLKLDMLGLRNLDVIQNTLAIIKQVHNVDIDVHNLPLDDNQTYDMISTGDYVSVFQLDSPGYRKLARQLKPDKYEHIMALNALFRPGPLGGGMTDEYVERRHGRKPSESMHPWLDEDLSTTYQLIVFQEQLLALAKKIAGFNGVEADKFRHAVGKKSQVEFDRAMSKFKDGALNREGLIPPPGCGKSLEAWVDDLIKKISGHARYSWNRGHCLDGSSLVLTCGRGLVPIKYINIGEEVWSIREKTGDIFRNRVMNVINNGRRDTVRVRSSDGRELVTTSNHRYFTSKQQYKHASELNYTDSLKMLDKGIFRRHFNIFVTSITNRNKVPFVVSLYNFIWYNVVKAKSFFGSTKDAHTPISFKKFISKRSANFPSFSYFNTRSSISEELINTSGINKDLSFSQSPRDCNLAFVPHTSYFKDCLSYFWRNCINAVTTQTTLFDKSGEGSGASFKWKFLKYILAAKSLCVQLPNQLFMFIIGVPFSIAYDAEAIVFGRSVNRNLFTAVTASDTLCILGPVKTSGAMIDRDIIRSDEDIGTFNTDYFNLFHIKPLEQKDITDVTFNSITPESNREVWDLTMEQDPNFIANGFVVHNSAGYGMITYVTAYLETHYPAEYYTTLLDSTDKADKITTLMRGIMHKNYAVVPPDVNESGVGYATNNNVIYMGLGSVRNVGNSAGEIVEERDRNGKFGSFIEFCQRLSSVNKTAKINLIKAGAFKWDKSLCDRDKADNIDVINKAVRRKNKKFDGTKVAPIEIATECYITGIDFTDIQRQQNEREVLNSFITGHPAAVYQRLAPYLERADSHVVCPSMIKDCQVGETVLLVGMVDTINKKFITKEGRNQGNPYLVVHISDERDSTMTNIWYPMCNDMEKILVPGQVGMFECITRADKFREGRISLSVKHAVMLTHGLPIQGIFVNNGHAPEAVLAKIGGMLNQIIDVGNKKYASIRGRITVNPDVLENAAHEFDGVKFLICMEASDG